MSKNYSLDLDFYKSKETVCLSPIMHIYIKKCTMRRNFNFICPECRTMKELDYQINRLQGELESIRKKAKRKFDEFKKKEEEGIRLNEKKEF